MDREEIKNRMYSIAETFKKNADKFFAGETLENEDWVDAAKDLNSCINYLIQTQRDFDEVRREEEPYEHSSAEAVDKEILKELKSGKRMDTSNFKYNSIVNAIVDTVKTKAPESLYRRDVFLDMMHRQIFLVFGKWVSIPPEDVYAEASGRIRFNSYRTRLQLEVGLDEFKERIGNIALIYSFKPEVK